MDKVTGALVIGTNESGEVVINHPNLETDQNGCGYLVFSPDQARHFARTLIKMAVRAEQETKVGSNG